MRTTTRRASARLDTTASLAVRAHQVSVGLGQDLRLVGRLELGEERDTTWAYDRMQVPLTVVYDGTLGRTTLRTRVDLPLLDRNQVLGYGTGSVSALYDLGALELEAGAGLLVGRPRDQYTLGRYAYFLVVPYPKLDVWVVF